MMTRTMFGDLFTAYVYV